MSRSNHIPPPPVDEAQAMVDTVKLAEIAAHAVAPIATLNEAQAKAVTSKAPTTYVIAGPGSGKTHTIRDRIRLRIAAGSDPSRMALMTFTNAGADTFTERLEGVKLGYVGTVHGFCLRLLQTYGHLIGYRKGGVSINVLSQEECETLLEQTRDALGLKKKVTMKAVNAKVASAVLGPQVFGYVDLVWRGYADLLKRNNMVDYDRILTEGRRLLQLDAVASALHIDELLIDETQDSGFADWAIYDDIRAKVVFAVGDPDQSLYAFRGGMPEILVERSKSPSATTILLETNYRSARSICEAASRLIGHNTGRVPKATRAFTGMQGHLTIFEYATDADELDGVAASLRAKNKVGLAPWDDMAVLCRTNAMVKKAKAILKAAGIPLAETATEDRPDGWARALLACALAVDPANNLYAARLIETPRGKAGVLEAQKSAEVLKIPLAQHCGIIVPTTLLDLPRFLSACSVRQASIDIIAEQIEAIRRPTGLAEFLQSLVSLDVFRGKAEAKPGVDVMTIHAAKGREWSVVHVTGLEDGTLPSAKADIEEERRVLFVAMTRAKFNLTLSWAHARHGEAHWQTRLDLKPSPFLLEI